MSGYAKSADSVEGFCARNSICKATLYNLWKRGEGPRYMQVGSRRLISSQAEADWHREREAAAQATAA